MRVKRQYGTRNGSWISNLHNPYFLDMCFPYKLLKSITFETLMMNLSQSSPPGLVNCVYIFLET